jgi:hypothetical protein
MACGVIFNDFVEAVDRIEGCVRFSYLPPDSAVPATYRCLPDKLVPAFTSTRFGDPAYAQLSPLCPPAFQHAAEDGDEIGVGHMAGALVRKQLLEETIAELLPLGLECEVTFVT